MQTELAFAKYQALGNAYSVVPATGIPQAAIPALAQTLCDSAYGIGGDGILLDYGPSKSDHYHVRIFNPDGSEAESSGNGLRIYAAHQFAKLHPTTTITIETQTARHVAHLKDDAIQVSMGAVTTGSHPEVLPIASFDDIRFLTVNVGNPHCVVLNQPATPEVTKQLGPKLEHHPRFPNRTNVQLLKVINKNTIQIEIWERGAGYTYSSGSSSCAAAVAANTLGYTHKTIDVITQGGNLQVDLRNLSDVLLTGPVSKICDGKVLVCLTS